MSLDTQYQQCYRRKWLSAERRWVLGFALIVMAITTIPYILGYATQGANWRFTGFVFGVQDGNSYIAKMLSGSAGAWLFRTPYTADTQRGVLAFPIYLWLGKLSAPPGQHEQLVVLYHIFRIVAGILAILAIFDFIAIFTQDTRIRRIGLVLTALGGGLGWLLVILGQDGWLGSLPLDFYSPESFGFLSLYGLPHLALARASMLWGLGAFLSGIGANSGTTLRNGLKCGGLWLLTAFAQPLTALVMGAVIGFTIAITAAWQLWRTWREETPEWNTWWRAVRIAVIAGIVPAPYLLYHALTFSLDPYLRQWTEQNRILSPHPAHYLVAYGLLIPFALVGIVYILRRYPWKGWLPVIWFLTFPVLAYLPVNLQRRLVDGVWVAMVILTLQILEYFVAKEISWKKVRNFQLLFLPLYLSTIMLLVGGALATTTPSEPLFRDLAETEAFVELVRFGRPGEVILTSFDTGNALPAWSPMRVVIGHGPESANLAELQPRVEAFFDHNTSDSDREDLLTRFNVRYVFWGPEEQILGDWNPGEAPYLRKIYSEGNYEIYQVELPSTYAGG